MPTYKYSKNKNHLKNRGEELPIPSSHAINDDIESTP